MEQSPRLSLSYVQPAQAQKHVTVNESFRRLDALTQLTVRSQTTAAEPGAPAEGDAYILPASPTGAAWAGFTAGNIAAFQDGAWAEITAAEGFRSWVSDTNQFAAFDGSSWVQISGGGSETAAKFGVNATADTTNRLSVKSDAVLFSYDDVTPGNDDCIVKVNKKAVADTASVIFQNNASGRAEVGLIGDDKLLMKVSSDGSSWTDAIKIDKSSGILSLLMFTEVSNDFRVKDATPVFVFEDSSGVGNNHTGLFSFRDDTSAQKAWFGLGGTSNSAFSFYNSYNDEINFYTNSAKRIYIGGSGGLVCGTPTGGDKGAGNINAKAVYDDNTLLSCYVFDQKLDGVIDLDKWDKKVSDEIILAETEFDQETMEERIIKPGRLAPRQHLPMRKFNTRIGGEYDPLTLDGYAKHWRDKRHLTAMPNEVTFDISKGMAAGEWIQRLVETAEIQAVLIEELNQRTKTPGEGGAKEARP